MSFWKKAPTWQTFSIGTVIQVVFSRNVNPNRREHNHPNSLVKPREL